MSRFNRWWRLALAEPRGETGKPRGTQLVGFFQPFDRSGLRRLGRRNDAASTCLQVALSMRGIL